MSQTKFSDINGTLCVQLSSMDSFDPVINRSHYPTELNTKDFMRNFSIESLDQLEITYQESYGIYQFCIKDSLCGPKWKVQLINGEKTRLIKFEKIPIPCPKVRKGINTRYNGNKGYWEKELKPGWCSA